MHLSHVSATRRRAAAFTLIEVMVTLVIVSVGMLGLAKLQAAAVAESGASRTRALMTLQAESLAGLMRGNRSFWASSTSPFPSFSIAGDGTAPTYSTAIVNGSDPACITSKCTPGQMAKADLVIWSNGFSGQFPGASASITCVTAAGTACVTSTIVPTSYDIKLAWRERYVAINASTAPSSTLPTVSMILHVQP
jgi:type IV pilus assembly protein PilV